MGDFLDMLFGLDEEAVKKKAADLTAKEEAEKKKKAAAAATTPKQPLTVKGAKETIRKRKETQDNRLKELLKD